ncbi:MAG: bifunctional phosphopantothenoylcysteine decarboxylase/phosphopantothenate--cysteine ligase CoaBC [Actinobacteria bacterium]|nr:bifunctional phosphopantothenoylcysteine decarboxylase/phosphopantothenate--cysteine ligase CoaBC [Actinomycetota bacterium]
MAKKKISFNKKRVMLGITGSIAAYKSAGICSKLVKLGAEVFPVMSPNAASFINPLTFSSISGNKTILDQFKNEEKIYHISLAHSIDIILVAPCTANTISKLAYGICDNFLTTTIVSSNSPVLIAPAMNEGMYLNPIIQENINKLKNIGTYFFVGPVKGKLACGEEGFGKMEDEDVILEKLGNLLSYCDDLNGKKVIVTAGGTKEYIDRVRYISNISSGKMGIALAEEAYFRGAEKVFLITANKNLSLPYGVDVIFVEDSREMKEQVLKYYKNSDVIIMAAAVSDVVPVKRFNYKLKKNDDIISKLKFKENINILKELASKKNRNQILVGFSAEDGININNVRDKFSGENIDLIIANDISRHDIGFESDFNEVIVLKKDSSEKKLKKDNKRIIARKIWDEINKINVN